MLTGNPRLVHKKVEAEKSAEASEEAPKKVVKEVDPLASSEEEDPAALIVPIDLKEIDRVHYLVRAIENDCQVVPAGTFKLTTAHETARNEAFRGLSLDAAFSLGSYSHFRNVQTKEKKEGLEKDDVIYQPNFLDDISVDRPPHGVWCLQKDSSSTAVLRNLLWPGSFAFHKAGTKQFGCVYIGDGIKNTDVAFQI